MILGFGKEDRECSGKGTVGRGAQITPLGRGEVRAAGPQESAPEGSSLWVTANHAESRREIDTTKTATCITTTPQTSPSFVESAICESTGEPLGSPGGNGSPRLKVTAMS